MKHLISVISGMCLILVFSSESLRPGHADNLGFEELKSTDRKVRRLSKRRISRKFDCMPYKSSTGRTQSRCSWVVVTKGVAIIPVDTDIGWELSVLDGAGGGYFYSPTLIQNIRRNSGSEQILIYRPSTDESHWVQVQRRNTELNSVELIGTSFVDNTNRIPFKKVWETVQWKPYRAVMTEDSIEQKFTETITIHRVDHIQKDYRQ